MKECHIMRKITILVLILSIILSIPSLSYASLRGHKLKQGIYDLFGAPFSVVTATVDQVKKAGPNGVLLGLTAGILDGAGQFTTKALRGAFNIVTFAIE